MTNLRPVNEIAPYSQTEVESALRRLADSDAFVRGIRYFYPDWTAETVRGKLAQCDSCADFQVAFIEPILRKTIAGMTSFEVVGLDDLSPEDCFLYISNHRDIFLDSGLLQYSLYYRGLPFTEISLGDNLIINPLIKDVAKLNNMFTVFRSGSKSELLKNARRLSAYLRHAVSEKTVSAWLAQGNGRTKDGNDQTFPGLYNMLLLSADGDYAAVMRDLRIMVATISYEYEPWAVQKARELYLRETTGSYTKTEFEDVESILHGIAQPKGRVRMVFEPLEVSDIDFSAGRKAIITALVAQTDRQMYRNYQLWTTNYAAYDLLHGGKKYADRYTAEELQNFNAYLHGLSAEETLRRRILRMYARPTKNAESL